MVSQRLDELLAAAPGPQPVLAAVLGPLASLAVMLGPKIVLTKPNPQIIQK